LHGETGTYDIALTQLAVSTSYDHQATENGHLILHNYTDSRTNAGSVGMQVSLNGNGFAFGYSHASTHSGNRTRVGDLTHEDTSGSDVTSVDQSWSLTTGNDSTSQDFDWSMSRDYDFTRQFQGPGTNPV
jgi:hypothetical protein